MSESSNSQLCSVDVPCGINMKTLCQSHQELWYVLPSPLPGENCYYKSLPIRLWASYALCLGAQPTLHSSSWVSKRENICTNLQKGLGQCWYRSLKYHRPEPPRMPSTMTPGLPPWPPPHHQVMKCTKHNRGLQNPTRQATMLVVCSDSSEPIPYGL